MWWESTVFCEVIILGQNCELVVIHQSYHITEVCVSELYLRLSVFAAYISNIRYPTHLPLVPHTCHGELSHHYSGNGLSPVRCKAITWTNAASLSIGSFGTYFREIWIEMKKAFIKMRLKASSVKWSQICYIGDESITDPLEFGGTLWVIMIPVERM